MKSNNLNERSQSILGAEDTQAQVLPLDDKKGKLAPEERKRVRSFAITALVSLLAVVAVFVVGAIYGNRAQREEAAREPRESTPIYTAAMEESDLKEGDITSVITQAYYTAENGMMVTVEFYNDRDTTQHISKVIVAIYTEEDAEIARAQSESMKADFVVAAGGTNEIQMYIKPEYVSIADDPLEVLTAKITVSAETVA